MSMTDIGAVVKFQCNATPCTASGLSREMWSLDKKATGGKRVIVCRECRKLAHQQGIKSYRLDYTHKWEEQQRQKREFFKAFRVVPAPKRNDNKKAGKKQSPVQKAPCTVEKACA